MTDTIEPPAISDHPLLDLQLPTPSLGGVLKEPRPPSYTARQQWQIRTLGEDLPVGEVEWSAEHETDCECHGGCEYAGGSLANVGAMNEAARVLLRLWPYPIQIDFWLIDVGSKDLSPNWQILSPDAEVIESVMVAWTRFTADLDRDDPAVWGRAAKALPGMPRVIVHALVAAFLSRPPKRIVKVTAQHRKVHTVVEARGESGSVTTARSG